MGLRSLAFDISKPVVAVTMANGKQGRGVVKHLANSGLFSVRALVRNPQSQKSIELLGLPNVEIIKADLLHLDSLINAFDGAYAVFGNTTPTKGWRLFRGSMVRDYEMSQGRNLVQSIKKMRDKGSLKHFVFSSICKCKDPLLTNPAPGHFSSKWDIEEYIKYNELQELTTILRPASYFENFYTTLPLISIANQYFPGVVHPDKKWQTIAVEDVGIWANAVLKQPEKFIGQAINLAGEELTGNQMAKTLESLKFSNQKKVTYSKLPRFLIRMIEHDIAIMASWIERSGYGANVTYLKKLAKEIDISMTSFSTWLKQKSLA